MLVPPDKRPLDAHVPLRCMLPRGMDGVIVTGLGMSAHRDALPVIRMQADVQNQGFAAGLVSARSAAAGCPVREVDLKAVQRVLADMGALAAETPGQGDSFPLSDERVKAAVAAFKGHEDAGVVFANPERSRDYLRLRLEEEGEGVAVEVGLALGLMGDTAAAAALLRVVRGGGWDDGWNYRHAPVWREPEPDGRGGGRAGADAAPGGGGGGGGEDPRTRGGRGVFACAGGGRGGDVPAERGAGGAVDGVVAAAGDRRACGDLDCGGLRGGGGGSE